MDVMPMRGTGGAAPPAGPAGPDAGAWLDQGAAAAFLHEQAECLAAGLASAEDPLAVRAVLRSHDSGHDTWLLLIAAVRSADRRAGDRLAAVYALHGRIAGSLEQGGRRVPDATLRRQLWTSLTRQLEAATADALAAARATLAEAATPSAG